MNNKWDKKSKKNELYETRFKPSTVYMFFFEIIEKEKKKNKLLNDFLV